MFLSKRSNGVYYLWYLDELDRKQKVSTRSRRKSGALKFVQQFRENEREKRARPKKISLSEFTNDYLRHSAAIHTPKSQRSCRTALSEFLRIVGDPPLHKIGIREIEHFLAVKKVEASEWTAKKYHATIASAFETARHWGMLIVNPFRSVTKPKVRDAQPAHFTKRDFQSLLAVVPDRDFRELCICAVSSGLRLGELHSLRWIDVDFVRKVIMVQNSDTFTTKSKRNRVVPMGEQLWHLLAVRREAASDARVFPMKSADHTSKVFKRYIRLAGLSEKLHFHSLRHTFATWLVQDGVPIYGVQKLLGHSSVKMTEVYSHLAASELHSAVNKINLALN